VLSACEGLDDEHRRAAVSAHKSGPGALVIDAVIGGVRWRGLMQKIASGGDLALAVGVGEQSSRTAATLFRW
jgi:hypothetical protein